MPHPAHRAGEADRRSTDVLEPVGEPAPGQRDRVGLEGVGEQALGPGEDVGAVDRPHLVGVGQVPVLVALARADAGALQFRAHGAVHEQHPAGMQGIEKA